MTFYCGWDGGGTRTTVCAMDMDGNVTAEAAFGPLNPTGAARKSVEDTVRGCVGFMKGLPGGLAACGGLTVGMAGISSQKAANDVETLIRQSGYLGPLRLTGDGDAALAGAVEGPGAVLIAGTGSVCYGRDGDGNLFRAGGYGHLLGDAGSAYAIGTAILRAVTRAFDGCAPKTCLTEAVLRELGLASPPDLIGWAYAPGADKTRFAALAPLLIPALGQNDAAAKDIERQAARDLADLATAVWRKAGLCAGELALAGGVLTRFEGVRAQVTDLLHGSLPLAEIRPPRRGAAHGAALLARANFS